MNKSTLIDNCKKEGSLILSFLRILNQYKEEYSPHVDSQSLIVIFNALYDVVYDIDKRTPGILKSTIIKSWERPRAVLNNVEQIFSRSEQSLDHLYFRLEIICSQIYCLISTIINTAVSDLPEYYTP